MIAAIEFDFSAIDQSSIIVAIVGYIIVFSALVALYMVFYNLPRVLRLLNGKHKKKSASTEKEQVVELSGEVNAAISMALYLHFNQYHDEESGHMTIKRESRIYSPWSSKIYQVRNSFNRI